MAYLLCVIRFMSTNARNIGYIFPFNNKLWTVYITLHKSNHPSPVCCNSMYSSITAAYRNRNHHQLIYTFCHNRKESDRRRGERKSWKQKRRKRKRRRKKKKLARAETTRLETVIKVEKIRLETVIRVEKIRPETVIRVEKIRLETVIRVEKIRLETVIRVEKIRPERTVRRRRRKVAGQKKKAKLVRTMAKQGQQLTSRKPWQPPEMTPICIYQVYPRVLCIGDLNTKVSVLLACRSLLYR